MSVKRTSRPYHTAAQAPNENPQMRSTLNSSITIGITASRRRYSGTNRKTGAANCRRQDRAVQQNKAPYTALMSGTNRRFRKKIERIVKKFANRQNVHFV